MPSFVCTGIVLTLAYHNLHSSWMMISSRILLSLHHFVVFSLGGRSPYIDMGRTWFSGCYVRLSREGPCSPGQDTRAPRLPSELTTSRPLAGRRFRIRVWKYIVSLLRLRVAPVISIEFAILPRSTIFTKISAIHYRWSNENGWPSS